jgi:hypothetical protein
MPLAFRKNMESGCKLFTSIIHKIVNDARSDISGFIKALNEKRCAVIFWFWLELVSWVWKVESWFNCKKCCM